MRKSCVRIGLFVLFASFTVSAQSRRAPAIAQAVDESKLVQLVGNTHPSATAENDRGPVDDSLALDHLLLQLKRTPDQEAAFQAFLTEQQDPGSPNYHHWLTSAELGERFGATSQDLGILTRWLESHGFTVNQVHPNGMLIDFSGTGGRVRSAFHTEIHNLEVNGVRHIGNMSDPQIPEALAPVVEGVVSLHDFMPRPLLVPRHEYTFTSGGVTLEAVVPGDLATIYNFNPAFTAGYRGAGQTIVVIEDSDVYSVNDFTTFRSTFGLSSYAGTLTQTHPAGTGGTCNDPGVNADDAEAEIDVEWSTAAAPDAAIVLASCADTRTNFGGFIALQNLLSEKTPPAIVSISYGEAETQLGAAGNAYISSLYSTAQAAGVAVFVAAGDEGAASADAGAASASNGITVSGYASTPYNVAVGGTDFADAYLGTVSTYWSSTNSSTYASAKSYIPEIPWNDSCASELIASVFGYSATYGANGFCASKTARSDGFLAVVAGSGGPSNCATGAPQGRSSAASGTCKGYAKPVFQTALTPGDGVRDIPDVAFFAANGVWGHYYVVCYSDPGRNRGGEPCTGAPSTWAGFGGTSVSTPVMAGVQALLNQKFGNQGNPNALLYSLAAGKNGSLIFNDVTLGDNDVNCNAGSPDCYDPANARNGGVLSTSTTSYAPAYKTGPGWDYATGIGSLNVWALLNYW